MKQYIFILFLVMATLLLFARISKAMEDNNCISCHRSLYNQYSSMADVHAPFMEGHCLACHPADAMSSKNANSYDSSEQEWLSSFDLSSGTHFIPISWTKNKDVSGILVEVKSSHLSSSQSSIYRVSLNNLSTYSGLDASLPPIVEKLAVTSVQIDSMVRVNVEWHTQFPSRCTVYYKVDGETENSWIEHGYCVNHTVTLDNLMRNKLYKLYVVAESFDGVETKSQTISFDTDSSYSSQDNEYDSNPETGLVKEINAVDINGNIYLKMVCTGDIFVRIAPDNTSQGYSKEGINTGMGVGIKATHLCGADLYKLGYLQCIKCHSNCSNPGETHPINVPIASDMHPPKDILLVNGKIVCITCHNPHASHYPHELLRRETSLCGCCHDLKHYAGNKIASHYDPFRKDAAVETEASILQ